MGSYNTPDAAVKDRSRNNSSISPHGMSTVFKPRSARTGSEFSQLSAVVVRDKANDGVACAIRTRF